VTTLPTRTVDPETGGSEDLPPGSASFWVGVIAFVTAALLIAFSGRYGYHRDELYFLECGRHLAWGYPDQPAFVPVVARLMSALAPGSLVVFRLPSAVAAAALILFTALNARELGGGRNAQVLASAAMAVSSVTLATGHLLSTTTFDLPVWAAITWLVIRIIRRGDERLWIVVGLIAGLGLNDNNLVAFLLVAIGVGIAIAGPRRVFRSPWLYAGAFLALAMWAPYLIWQATHGWPEIAVSRSIAAGRSGTSTPRWELIPEQLVLVSPYLAPVWICGLVRLVRDSGLRCRAIGIAYLTVAVVFLVSGGKAYYLAGMFPVLLGAGAQPTIDWVARGTKQRRDWLVLGFVLSLLVIPVTLPVVPVGLVHDTPIVALNYDAGETIGWPTYVGEIAAVYKTLPSAQRAATIVLASNYGEAGAVDHFGAGYDLPAAYSGQNAFWYWGPPPASATTAIAVGFDRSALQGICGSLELAAHLNNHLGVHDQEQGAPVWICSSLISPWSSVWTGLRNFG
jgi:Dolichyl-phosphate-mannose-protein mannosyltransferase